MVELDEFLKRELADDGYSASQVRESRKYTEVIILATKTQSVLGEDSLRIRELASVLQKRFGFSDCALGLFVDKMIFRGLSAIAQAESLRYKLTYGLPVRKACYGILRFIIESGARGVGVIVSGKIKDQRAKAMKFCNGLIIHSGDPVNNYID
ncbi:putative 40s ribosomal protein S3 [Schistosoma mansoni]|uniref:40S ribosomal protein S3 n=1 Tax=Schistosoma mansoni TaxID=6183 RepID=G4VTK8_SCHMA|nr:putative 40s ribosomal protein S3 [Schistosoma mansoni]|eukprot:XP_018655650.1 putative 40s ribosomal protein S3 [Schistosoma mansoni]